jgi:hypothetical protein
MARATCADKLGRTSTSVGEKAVTGALSLNAQGRWHRLDGAIVRFPRRSVRDFFGTK